MSERDAPPVTQADIEEGVRALGLRAGDIVEVHSSLSRFGWVEGGAATVVDALMSVVGEEGTIVMSAFPVSKPLPSSDAERAAGLHAKVRIYGPEYAGPTGMGVIADEFRLRPGTVLGTGLHRVAAWGRERERMRRGYGELLAADGWALLLGVDIERCSSMHHAERVGLPPEVTACFRPPDELRAQYPEDIFLDYGGTPERAWLKIQAEAERQGLIRRRTIGQADCRMFRARMVVGLYEEALCADPLGLYGLT